jgi:hypothetical protein
MGKLIATAQATIDGVIDPVGEWVQPDGDHGDYSFERQARSGGLVLGRKTYEGLAGYWPSQTGKWADMVNALPKYVGSNTVTASAPSHDHPTTDGAGGFGYPHCQRGKSRGPAVHQAARRGPRAPPSAPPSGAGRSVSTWSASGAPAACDAASTWA